MFKHLSKFKNIIVTGAHRSGTTFIANAIAYDTGKTFFDESEIYHNKVRFIPDLLDREEGIVLQAPYALPWLPVLNRIDTAFVFCKRSVNDIRKSVHTSITKKGKIISLPAFSPEQAFNIWLYVKHFVDNPFEVKYEDMIQHPLYVAQDKRKNWHHKQIDSSGKRYNRRTFR